jgi:DNA-binding beta-propeller fold protein YncE
LKTAVLRALLAIFMLCSALVGDAAAASGDLIQKQGAAGCLGVPAGCSPGRSLVGVSAVTVSPDGRNAYAASNHSGSVVIFDRRSDGTLSQKRGSRGCVSLSGRESCARGRVLLGPVDVTVSPDGRNVYVAGYGNDVAIFDRSRDGSLKQKRGRDGCLSEAFERLGCTQGNFVDSAVSVVVSPDGRNVYVASLDGGVAIIDRARDGTLEQDPGREGCISLYEGWGGCAGGRALDHAAWVAVSPDGENVYVASQMDDEADDSETEGAGAVAVFNRARGGRLKQKRGKAGCISEDGSDGGEGKCVDGRGLSEARSVAVSPDGRSVYIASGGREYTDDNALAIFDRSSTGRLTQKRRTAGCFALAGRECVENRGLDGPASVTVSPDGGSVYVASVDGDSLTLFDRAEDGALTPDSQSAGCISSERKSPCARGRALGGAAGVEVSPDGRSLYVASFRRDTLAVFDRLPAPPPASRGGFRVVTDRPEVVGRGRVTVLCKLRPGAALRACSLRLIAIGAGADGSSVTIGRARIAFERPWRARARVAVRLNPRGRALLRARPNGIRARLEARAARFGAPTVRASARTRVVAGGRRPSG